MNYLESSYFFDYDSKIIQELIAEYENGSFSEKEKAVSSHTLQYYGYLKRFRINFATKEDVDMERTDILIQGEDYKFPYPGKKKKSGKKRKRKGKKVGRNSPCPCGSGKKYKKCCMGKDM